MRKKLLQLIEDGSQGEIIKLDGDLTLKLTFEYLMHYEDDKENGIQESWTAVGWSIGPSSRNNVSFNPSKIFNIERPTKEFCRIILK